MLEARAAVRALHPYEPPRDGDVPVRLHLNENTFGCSDKVLEVLRQLTPIEIARYPEREPVERLIAERLGIQPEQILLTNGADEALHLACLAYLEVGAQAVTTVPTFTLYPIYTRVTGAELLEVPSLADFEFPLRAVLGAITDKTKLILIANPNNPTGASVREEDIARIASAAPNAAVLADEAYFEFHGRTMLTYLDSLPNLLIARTFSKAYGLAGMRIGYLAGHVEQIAVIRRFSSPFNVNGVALRCLPAALADEAHMRMCVRNIVEGRAWMSSALTSLGIKNWPSHSNFLLARFADAREEFLRATARDGIAVRDRHSQPFCKGCVRISIGTPEQNSRVLQAARTNLGQLGISS